MGLRQADDADLLAEATAFCAGLGLAMRLSDHGVDRQALPGMAVQAHAIRRLMDFNPRDLSVGDIEAIYQAAY